MQYAANIWRLWKRLGRFMGNAIARLALTIFYFTVLPPFAITFRLLGDRLALSPSPNPEWVPRDSTVPTINAARRQG